MYMPFTYYPCAQPDIIMAPTRPDAIYKWGFAPLDEVFVRVAPIYPRVIDIYLISNYGRVYNERLQAFNNINFTSDGYAICSLIKDRTSPLNYGTTARNHQTRVHVLVCLAFIGPRPSEIHVVNHKDCKRYNNYYKNLEWVTPAENTQYAYKMGNLGYGEDQANSLYTNNQIHQVCQLMEAGYDYHQIAIGVFGVPLNINLKYLFEDIKKKRSWLTISEQYNLPEVKKRAFVPADDIHKICLFLQNNYDAITDLSLIQVAQNSGVNVDFNDPAIRARYTGAVNQIINKSAYKPIIAQYSFPDKIA